MLFTLLIKLWVADLHLLQVRSIQNNGVIQINIVVGTLNSWQELLDSIRILSFDTRHHMSRKFTIYLFHI